MSLNAKPKMIYENSFSHGTPLATNTDSDSQYDVLNLGDNRYYTLWKALAAGTLYLTADPNLISNAGFENDFTDWTQNNASIEAVIVKSGSKSSKLVAIGADILGAVSDPYDVDATKIYEAKAWNNVTVNTKGDYKISIFFYDSTDTAIGTAVNVGQYAATTSGFELAEATFGPVGAGADHDFPAGTVAVRYRQRWSNGTNDPTGTAYSDVCTFGLQINATAMAIFNHNLFSANASVSLEIFDDATFAWVEEIATFTPTSDLGFVKLFTTQTRAWRIKIVTVNVVPYVGAAQIGSVFTFEKYALGPFDPDPENQKSETTKSMAGYPMGTIIDYYKRQISVNFRLLSPDWVTDTFSTLWTHLRQGLPVVWMWDITNHADEVYFGSLPPNFKRSMPYTPVTRTLNIKLDTIVEEE